MGFRGEQGAALRYFVSGLQPSDVFGGLTQASGLGCDVAAPLALNKGNSGFPAGNDRKKSKGKC